VLIRVYPRSSAAKAVSASPLTCENTTAKNPAYPDYENTAAQNRIEQPIAAFPLK
jgi:hypothetical protein